MRWSLSSFSKASQQFLLSYRYSCICITILLLSACKISNAHKAYLTQLPGYPDNIIPKDAEQILIVASKSNELTHQGILFVLENKKGKKVNVFDPMKVSLGRSGIISSTLKREGDGATPAGFYRLGQLFSYESTINTHLPFIQVTREDKWIDDSTSSDYNTHVRGATQAKSYENLLLASIDYKYCMVIEYNTHPVVKGRGSAIFFHITTKEYPSTAGCVAVQESDMLRILSWLDPNKKKYIGIIP
ncbi:MAG: L,D-transpeptidase family protein [Chitinophagia bacterium]|jgi:L,D-peptidoglycan transpeptidase YkuD (ErfK/YbiS/YcfS/YnhG family)